MVSEQLRADSLACYGHPLVKTPNFDKVASEGVLFENCYSQNPVCTPSRCCMMTGHYPHVSGHRTLWHLLRPHEKSLFGYLKNNGHHIQWHGKNDLYSKDSFKDNVDFRNARPGKTHGPNSFKFGEPGYYSFLHEPFPGKAEETNDGQDILDAVEFLKNRKTCDKPFTLYLPMSFTHPEYAAPRPFHDMYNPLGVPALRPPDIGGKPSFYSLIRKYRELSRFDEDFFRKINSVYLGMVSCADYLLGLILDTLDSEGLSGDTAVILTADHGDWAGDYGLVEKWPNCFDDTHVRVPLIIKMPGGKKGLRIKEPVESFDISATILDAENIEPGHTSFARSQLPSIIEGKPADPDRAVFAEGGYNLNEPHCFEGVGAFFEDKEELYYPKGIQQQEHPESVTRTVMIRRGKYKLIRRPAEISELYDLETDPQELKNLYEDPAFNEIRSELTQELTDWYIRTSDAVPFDKDERN
ncbi:MAG: sulfatase-like hydrolase/transferase [Fibrobacterota bacterium]